MEEGGVSALPPVGPVEFLGVKPGGFGPDFASDSMVDDAPDDLLPIRDAGGAGVVVVALPFFEEPLANVTGAAPLDGTIILFYSPVYIGVFAPGGVEAQGDVGPGEWQVSLRPPENVHIEGYDEALGEVAGDAGQKDSGGVEVAMDGREVGVVVDLDPGRGVVEFVDPRGAIGNDHEGFVDDLAEFLDPAAGEFSPVVADRPFLGVSVCECGVVHMT